MLDTRTEVRALTRVDLPAFRAVVDADPLTNVFLRYRADTTGLEPRWLGGQMLGLFHDGRLTAVCHSGANIVPGQADTQAAEAFAERLSHSTVVPSSIAGPRESVLTMWDHLEPLWGPARSPRLSQPFLVIDEDSHVAPDLRLRRVMVDEIDVLYPACVQMFTDEVGVDPETSHGSMYRARVAQLIAQGWSFAIIEDGDVLFKAEIGAAAAGVCQLQGVYVRPDQRGRGIAVPALAALIREVRRSIAPAVTLYVNDHNVAARRSYESVGFREHGSFASILM